MCVCVYVYVCVCPRQLSSSTIRGWGVGNVLCAAKSTQELIVQIITVRISPGIIGVMLPFLGFSIQDWYHDSTRDLTGTSVYQLPFGHRYHMITIIVGYFKVQGVCVCAMYVSHCRNYS